jgi:hypothetical protein
MENFVNDVRNKINENSDMFEIGYEMVQYVIDKFDLEKLNYEDLTSELEAQDERLTFILLLKNLIYQVNNGGFSQYFHNGYANFDKRDNHNDLDAHNDLIKLFKKYVPKNDDTTKLLNILERFNENIYEDICEYCGGSGEYCEEECDECDGTGYIEDERCEQCHGRGTVDTECLDCSGTGESDYLTYHGNDDSEFYNVCNEDMEKFFKELFLNWLDNWDKDCILNQFNDCKNESNSNSKPKLKLVGTDGNAFAIIGRLTECLRKNGYTTEQLKEIQKECMSSDYNNVIATACKYCEVY